MRFHLTILFIIGSFSVFAQSKINDYEYIIIPHKFDFQKSPNSYQINALLKFLFIKEGFTAVYNDDKLPEVLAENPCNGLTARLVNLSTMFSTKVQLELIDCRNQNILTTGIGKSREKIIKKGFYFAIKMAFRDIEKLNYAYHKFNKENDKVEIVEVNKTPKVNLKENKNVKDIKKSDVNPINVPNESRNIEKNKRIKYYRYINQELKIGATEHGFIISRKEDNVSYVQFGILIKSSIKNVYLFQYSNNAKNNTIAYFDQNGNLIINDFEILSIDGNATKKVYKLIE